MQDSGLTVRTPLNAYTRIAAYSIEGKLVWQRSIQPGSTQYWIDLAGMGNGLYLIRIEGKRIRSGKLVLSR